MLLNGFFVMLKALLPFSQRPVSALGFLMYELPGDAHVVVAQFLAEMRGATAVDEDHGHDLLLRDVI